MLKKFVLFALIMLPAVAFAQDKIAYVNRGDVILAMPEYQQMMDSLKKAEAEYQAQMKDFNEEHAKKLADYYSQRDSLSENIRAYKEKEIEDVVQRANNFSQYAAQMQEETQQSLLNPILVKFQKAVDDTGKENNFLYIIDSQAILYFSSNAVDATPLVKRKLGIQ